MRFTQLSALALVAMSLLSMNAPAAALNRKFHPVVNDDPRNSHLNVQTPGSDANQTVIIQQEPGPDGQVIPAGETAIASCAAKEANGDIDLSGAASCPSAPAPVRAAVAAPAIGQPPSARTASRTILSLTSASVAQAGHASNAAPVARQAEEAIPSTALSPAPENAQVPVSVRQPAAVVRAAARAHVIHNAYADMRWLEIGLFGFAAALLAAVGLALLYHICLAGLLLRRDARRPGEELETSKLASLRTIESRISK